MEGHTGASPKAKRETGVYAGGSVPGTYIKTLTGVTRGEELFCRPDLERPWRSSEAQRRSADVAHKEREIESLLRLCSSLRSQLGNAKSDARYVEYAVVEKTKKEMERKNETILRLEEELKTARREKDEVSEGCEHQIRLMKSQCENELASLKTEARLCADRCAELNRSCQKQIEEVKAACAREVEYVESRFNAMVVELTAELKAARQINTAAEEHYVEQVTATKNLSNRIESDYKERLRSSEQLIEALRKTNEISLEEERRQKVAALEDLRKTTERLVISLADCSDGVQKFKLWSGYILDALDKFYLTYVSALPECAVEPVDPDLYQAPSIYAPREVLEDPEGKLTVERVVYRLLQLKLTKTFSLPVETAKAEHPTEALAHRLSEKQGRLQRALQEVEERFFEMDATVSSVLSRLHFFSDNLESVVHHAPEVVAPPLSDVLFVCLSVVGGGVLWADDPEVMRSSVTLMYGTLRLKMREYGAYECYSDACSMLLAFGDATAAARFCVESQLWLLSVPWPSTLMQKPHCVSEDDPARGPLFRGLRVSMAIHAGEAFVESSALPSMGQSRSHYYGKAVSQVVCMSSLAQGGQVIISKPAWQRCLRQRHELSSVEAASLGALPIHSVNSESGLPEEEVMELIQLSCSPLRGRAFRPLTKEELRPGSSLEGMNNAVIATEIDALDQRRAALTETMDLVKAEMEWTQGATDSLFLRAQREQTQFHLLSPPQMVEHLNDLFNLIERVAVRAEDLQTDVESLNDLQEDLGRQGSVLVEHFRQRMAVESRESGMQTEIDVLNQRLEHSIHAMRQNHHRELEKLHTALHERDQIIRKLHQKSLGVGSSMAHPQERVERAGHGRTEKRGSL